MKKKFSFRRVAMGLMMFPSCPIVELKLWDYNKTNMTGKPIFGPPKNSPFVQIL